MILVADQKRMTAELLVNRLRMDGLAAEVGPTAEAVERRIKQGGIQVVVLDPALPGSGLNLLARLRSEPQTASLPVLLFSASDSPADREAARRAGATAFLVKGRVSPNQFVAYIHRLLEKVKATDVAVSPSQPSVYRLHLEPQWGDAPKLASYLGLPSSLCCPRCGSRVALKLGLDSGNWGYWMMGKFGCETCAKAVPLPRPTAELRRNVS